MSEEREHCWHFISVNLLCVLIHGNFQEKLCTFPRLTQHTHYNFSPYLSNRHTINYHRCIGNGWAGQLSRHSDWLRAGRSGDRIPVAAKFSAPVQTGPGAHPASCTMGTGSFSGVKSGRGVTRTPHPLLVPLVKIWQSYTSTPPMGRTSCTEPQCLYKGALYLYLIGNGDMSIMFYLQRQLS